MKLGLSIALAFLTGILLGCTTPRLPPGWPSGDERPINPSQVKAAK
jgi:hypothetical protein